MKIPNSIRRIGRPGRVVRIAVVVGSIAQLLPAGSAAAGVISASFLAEETALSRQLRAGAVVTAELHGDAACASAPVASRSVAVQDIDVRERVETLKIKGDSAKPPKAVRLRFDLTLDALPTADLYLKVTSSVSGAVIGIPNDCQPQLPDPMQSKYVVQDEVDGGPTRGIWMWNATDSNWGIYMGQSGAGKSLAGQTATGGYGFGKHAIRLRSGNDAQGIVFENGDEQLNFSVRGDDGLTYARGDLVTDGGLSVSGVASIAGNLKTFANLGVQGRIDVGSDDTVLRRSSTGTFGDVEGLPFRTALDGGPVQAALLESHTCENLSAGVMAGGQGVSVWGPGEACQKFDDLFNVFDSHTGTDPEVVKHFAVDYAGNVHVLDGFLSLHAGTAYKPGGGSWEVYSDGRLKNVLGRYDRGLKEIMQLQPIRYRYKDGALAGLTSETEYTGFVAQDVEAAIPEAVGKTEEGYLTVKADPIHWATINALKELKQLSDSTQAEQAALKEENASLKQQLASLESSVRANEVRVAALIQASGTMAAACETSQAGVGSTPSAM